VQQLDNVYLYNIDHLESIVRENLRSRQHELSHCHKIIASHAAEFLARLTPPPTKSVPVAKPEMGWLRTAPALISQPV